MALLQVAIPILSFHEGSASNAWDHDSILARTQARLTTYCAGLCFKSLASKFLVFFYEEQVPSLNSKDSSFVTVTKTKEHYQSFAPVCLMTRHLMKLVFRPLFHISFIFLTLPSATTVTNLTSY